MNRPVSNKRQIKATRTGLNYIAPKHRGYDVVKVGLSEARLYPYKGKKSSVRVKNVKGRLLGIMVQTSTGTWNAVSEATNGVKHGTDQRSGASFLFAEDQRSRAR